MSFNKLLSRIERLESQQFMINEDDYLEQANQLMKDINNANISDEDRNTLYDIVNHF